MRLMITCDGNVSITEWENKEMHGVGVFEECINCVRIPVIDTYMHAVESCKFLSHMVSRRT